MRNEKQTFGRDQVAHGKLREETVAAFLSVFPPEVSKMIEQRIYQLKPIKGENKFKAEAIKLLMDIYLIGISHGADKPAEVTAMMKKYKTTEG